MNWPTVSGETRGKRTVVTPIGNPLAAAVGIFSRAGISSATNMPSDLIDSFILASP
jgi:hypothetical protein